MKILQFNLPVYINDPVYLDAFKFTGNHAMIKWEVRPYGDIYLPDNGELHFRRQGQTINLFQLR